MQNNLALLIVSIALFSSWAAAMPLGGTNHSGNGSHRGHVGYHGYGGHHGACKVTNVTSGEIINERNCSSNSTCAGGPLRVSSGSDVWEVTFCESTPSQNGQVCSAAYSNGTEKSSRQCLFGSCDVAQEVVETSCDNFTLTFCNKQATYAARLVGVACEVINSEGDALVNRSCDVICPTSNSSAVQVTDPSANNTLEAYFCDVDAFIQRLSGVSNGYNESSREMDDSKKVGAEQHLCDDGKSSEEIGSREHQGGRSNGHRGGKSHGNSKSDESNSDESEESNSNSDESDESNSNSDESDESSSNSDESNQGPRRFGGSFGTPRRGGRRGNRG